MAVNTCDPALRSWVKSAQTPGTDFPIQNLPFGVARIAGEDAPRIVVAIGDRALNLHALAEAGVLVSLGEVTIAACRQSTLNTLMALPHPSLRTLRERLSALLEEARVETMPHRGAVEAALKPQSGLEMLLPADIGDYTDFYASIFHATNVGKLFRAELQICADRLSRPRIFYRAQRHSGPEAARTTRRCRGTGANIRANAPARLRAGSRRLCRQTEHAERARSYQRSARASLRAFPGE
jgi:fumarylacetoacetase